MDIWFRGDLNVKISVNLVSIPTDDVIVPLWNHSCSMNDEVMLAMVDLSFIYGGEIVD